MKAAEIVGALLKNGVHLWVEDGKLRYRALKRTSIQSELQIEIGEHRAEIIALLAPQRKYSALSFAQQRLWILDQLEPEGALAYTIPMVSCLMGRLDVGALEHALAEIVRRHEVLRTTFGVVNDEPVQLVAAPTPNFPLQVISLEDVLEMKREEKAQQQIAEELGRRFDLAQGPLCRATVIKLGEDEQILVLTMHHIIADGWSLNIFTRELITLYNAFARGESSPLAELPIQYIDYVAWQREWLQGNVLDEQLAYWKKRLAGASPLLELSTDRPRPAAQIFRGARQEFQFPHSLSEGLKVLSQQAGATMFMLLLAALQTLLYRYIYQDDFCIGMPTAGRSNAQVEGLIGFFVNTLVFRAEMAGDPTFLELLMRVRQQALETYGHQDLPFEQLVDTLQVQRDLSRSPLFQIMLSFQNLPREGDELKWAGLTRRSFSLDDTRASAFDLTLYIWDTSKGLQGNVEYNADLFDESSIIRLLGHFEVLLEGIVANPGLKLSALPLLTAAEHEQILVEWNDTKAEYSQEKCIHELFEEQVKRTPDAVAAVFGAQQLSYQELNERSNQLAHYLRSLGVGPDVLVMICVGRSLEMVVGLLGILKAGGAYVPLDPAYPTERLAYMLEDTRSPVLLSQERLLGLLPECSATTICLDRDWNTVSRESSKNLDNMSSPENLVYVIYTSGSTGKPKAVGMAHRSLVNLLTWQFQNLESDVVYKTLQFAPLSFDVSFQEIASTVCSGGTLFLISEDLRRDMDGLLNFLDDQSIERVYVPFVVLQHISEFAVAQNKTWSSLREIITAGEQLQITPAIKNLFQKLGGCRLYNHYGPTETHAATAYALPSLPEEWTHLPPIGTPISNASVYLLDQFLNPVPVGTIGRLYIGGDGLARGYINHPGLTAEKFVPNPFSRQKGQRLYFSGDLACYLPDGSIEFMGRIDQQVKIRGFRIELGEIEAALAALPDVREVVVLVREDIPSEKRLVAYLVGKGLLDTAAIRSKLLQSLPEYMIPTHFIPLKQLPLTPNGKLDRKALPAPSGKRSETSIDFVGPRTVTEELLTGMWAEVLRVEQVSIHDNFFELGGHSMLAVNLVGRMKRAGLYVDVRAFFRTPTICELAAEVEKVKKIGEKKKLGRPKGSKNKDKLIAETDIDILTSLIEEIEQLSDDEVRAQLDT